MNGTKKIKSVVEDGVLEDFYELLGVGIDATDEEIEKGYHTQFEIHYLDCSDGDTGMVRRIVKAYNTLSDPKTRSVYNIFYNELINRKNNTQDVSVEPIRDSEAVTQDVSKKSVQSHDVDHFSNNSSSMNKHSNFTTSYINSTKKKGTSYAFEVSPNAIRNTLRKHDYSEKTINDFLTWCQEHHMKITNGKELHSVFLKYLSVSKKTKESVHPESNVSSNRENARYNLKRDNCYHRKKSAHQNKRRKAHNHITFHFPFHRELKVCQTFVKSSIRNLQIFDFQAFVTLVHTIQNVTIFFSENRNNYRKRNVKVKHH